MPARNDVPGILVSMETLFMFRWLFFILSAFPAVFNTGCRSSGVLNESSFYGTWSKGTQVGDSLVFFRRGTKNIMRYAASFNPNLPLYNETEFAYKNERLYIANPYSMTAMTTLEPLEAFSWVTPGKVFTSHVNQIYLFLSAYPAKATFNKIQ